MSVEHSAADVGSIHDARRDMYRQQVIRAAEVEFAKAGFDATPMNAIAATSGLSLHTVYKTFSGKAEIWDAIYADRNGALMEFVQNAGPGTSNLDRLLNGVRHVAMFLVDNPTYLDLSLHSSVGWASATTEGQGLQRTVWAAGLDMIAGGVEAAIAAGEVAGIRPRVAAGLIVSALQVWLSDWVSTDRTSDAPELVDHMVARLRWMLVGPLSV